MGNLYKLSKSVQIKQLNVRHNNKKTKNRTTIVTLNLLSNNHVVILPNKVSETSGQVHRGWAAAQHGQDALEVEELHELMPTGAQ